MSSNNEWHIGEFIPIPAYRSKYGINKHGDVISYIRWRNPQPKLLKVWINKYGYKCITLINMDNSKQKSILIHRLLAEIFLPDYDPKLHVNHKDANKLNNSLDNLEMVTPQGNAMHAAKMGLMNKKLNPHQVREIKTLIQEDLLELKEIAEIFNVSATLISNIKRNKSWKYL